MNPALTLRAVRADELALLAEILGELDDGAALPIEQLQESWLAMKRHPDYCAYFALHDGQIVGCLSMIVFPVLSHGPACEAIVESVVIRPAYRKRGLGKAMMHAAMALAAAKGAYKLVLSSNAGRIGAHRFYETLGFQRHGYSFSIDLEEKP